MILSAAKTPPTAATATIVKRRRMGPATAGFVFILGENNLIFWRACCRGSSCKAEEVYFMVYEGRILSFWRFICTFTCLLWLSDMTCSDQPVAWFGENWSHSQFSCSGGTDVSWPRRPFLAPCAKILRNSGEIKLSQHSAAIHSYHVRKMTFRTGNKTDENHGRIHVTLWGISREAPWIPSVNPKTNSLL